MQKMNATTKSKRIIYSERKKLNFNHRKKNDTNITLFNVVNGLK